MPFYLVAVIKDYFRDKKLVYYDRDAERNERTMSGDVPQGSILGPLLWSITYDEVLPYRLLRRRHVSVGRGRKLGGCH